MQIETWKTKDVHPYPGNPRKNDSAVAATAESIRRFGFLVPIVVDKDGTIAAGHTRLKAAEQLGLETVPVIRAEDLTPEQVKAYRLADNRTSEISEWDDEALARELDELASAGVLMADLGFPEADLPDMSELDEDASGPDQIELRTKTGDLWKLGRHRLVVGDATDERVVRKVCCGHKIDLLETDPPYGVDQEQIAEVRSANRATSAIANDALDDEALGELVSKALANAVAVMRPGAAYYCWHPVMKTAVFMTGCAKAGIPARQVLIWVKDTFALTRQDYQWAHEPCLYGWKPGAAHYFTFDRSQETVIDEPREHLRHLSKQVLIEAILEARDEANGPLDCIREAKPRTSDWHPTSKPVHLIARQILNSTRPGGRVLDPFLGGGTTMLACEATGRTCHGVEIDPIWASAAITRWEQQTGKRAEVLDGSVA